MKIKTIYLIKNLIMNFLKFKVEFPKKRKNLSKILDLN